MIDRLKLPFQFDPARLQADLHALHADDWVPHFNRAYYEGDWSGVALRAVGGVARQLYPDPAAQQPFADTEILERCPYVQTVLATLECPLQAVRFLKLRAGSSIREHRDYKLDFEDGEIRLHVPVITDAAVEFYLNRQRLNMQPGDMWYLNLSLPHHVINHSTIDRVHLVIDCVVNDWVRDLFAAHAPASAA